MSILDDYVDVFRGLLTGEYPDSCVASRVTGTTFNDTTGQTEETTATAYSGECLYRPAGAGETDFGEDRRQELDGTLHLPHTAAILEEGDKVVVTSTTDPDIPTLTVTRRIADSYLTEHIYETKAVTDD